MDGDGLVIGAVGTLTVATASSITVVLARMVRLPSVLQRHPGRPGSSAARPGSVRTARAGLRSPRTQRPGRLGRRHLPRPGLQPLDAAHVRCTVRRGAAAVLCSRGGCQTVASHQAQAAVVVARTCRHLLRQPWRNPDFAWAFPSRFLLVMAYAFLVTYQAYYLIAQVGTAEADVPRQVYLGTVVQSVALVTSHPSRGACPTVSVAGRSSSWARRHLRRGTLIIAASSTFEGYLVGMAVGGIGFGDVHGRRPRPRRRRARRPGSPPPRTSASSTSPAPCRSPSPPPSRRCSCPRTRQLLGPLRRSRGLRRRRRRSRSCRSDGSGRPREQPHGATRGRRLAWRDAAALR